jgi:hypothetical protein
LEKRKKPIKVVRFDQSKTRTQHTNEMGHWRQNGQNQEERTREMPSDVDAEGKLPDSIKRGPVDSGSSVL